jgi:hypothetical protein
MIHPLVSLKCIYFRELYLQRIFSEDSAAWRWLNVPQLKQPIADVIMSDGGAERGDNLSVWYILSHLFAF